LLGGVGLGIDDELCIVSADGLVGGRLASFLVGFLVSRDLAKGYPIGFTLVNNGVLCGRNSD
jgi:hypothetical protein